MSRAANLSFAPQPPALPHDSHKPESQSAFCFKLFFAALLLGCALEIANPFWFSSPFQHEGEFRILATLSIAFLTSVLVHELGHLLPALCFGFHISRLTLGPVCAVRANSRWRLRYSRSLVSASVTAIPSNDYSWRKRMLVVVGCGPLASLLLFLFAAYVLYSSGPFLSGAQFWSALAQINFFLFVLGLLPNGRNAPVRNDARLFLTLLRNGYDAEQILLYHSVTRLQIAGARPQSYPNELVTRLASAKGNYELMLFNALTIFLWALDSGDLMAAEAWDRHANALLEGRVLRLSDSVICESACFDLLHRNLPRSAADKIRTTNIETLPSLPKNRATAVLQIAEGAYSNALVTISEMRIAYPPVLPYFEFELAILDLLEHRALAANSPLLVVHAAA